MTDQSLDERLRAVERALTDDETTLPDLSNEAALSEETDDLARRVDALEGQQAELDAAVQALRGYVGNVRAVNRDVERRADAALAAVDSLENADDRQPGVTIPRVQYEPRPVIDGADGTRPDGDEGGTDGDEGLVERVREAL